MTMSVGTCELSVSLVGQTLVGNPTGDAGGLALFYLQYRSARFLASINASLQASIAGASGVALQNVLSGILAGAQSMAAQLAEQCVDDAELVLYLQENPQPGTPGPAGPAGANGAVGPAGATGAAGPAGSGSFPWIPVARGLTTSLQASRGINLQSGTSNIVRIYDQAPAKLGQSWYQNGDPTWQTLGTLNGLPAIVFRYLVGNGSGIFSPATSNPGGQTMAPYVSSQEFSVGAVLEYTGSKAIAIGQDLRTVYEVFGETNGGSALAMGLAVGTGGGGVQFLAWINDSGNSGFTVIDGTNIKGMISTAVSAAVAHTVLLTFNATSGVYSLNVDSLAPVQITGVGPVQHLQVPLSDPVAFFSNGVQNGGMTVAELDTWCVELTSPERATMLAWLNAAGGI